MLPPITSKVIMAAHTLSAPTATLPSFDAYFLSGIAFHCGTKSTQGGNVGQLPERMR